jgi:hypothetical protein
MAERRPEGQQMMSTAAKRRALIVERAVLGDDATAIAERVGLSARHVRRVLAEPAVKGQLRELEAERLRAVARRAASLGSSAVATLASISGDRKEPAAARVSAAKALLDVMLKVGELATIDERLTALEALLEQTRHAATPSASANGRQDGGFTWSRRTAPTSGGA